MMFRYGGPLQLLELTPEQVDVRDIVHGLGQINRFNGQSARPIPVLWHSPDGHAAVRGARPRHETGGALP